MPELTGLDEERGEGRGPRFLGMAVKSKVFKSFSSREMQARPSPALESSKKGRRRLPILGRGRTKRDLLLRGGHSPGRDPETSGGRARALLGASVFSGSPLIPPCPDASLSGGCGDGVAPLPGGGPNAPFGIGVRRRAAAAGSRAQGGRRRCPDPASLLWPLGSRRTLSPTWAKKGRGSQAKPSGAQLARFRLKGAGGARDASPTRFGSDPGANAHFFLSCRASHSRLSVGSGWVSL